MKEDWKECKLGDCVSILGDGLHGTPKYTHNGEYAFINGNNLVNGKIIIKTETKRVNNEEYLKYKKNLNDRTIFVSINGTIGNVGTYNGEKIILGKSACYFNVLDNIDKTFIKYIVSSPLFKIYLETNATGTTIKNVSLAQMRNYSFYLPPLATQQKIATILSSLDDKIELNNKINQNLEQQAQAIFKSWFVDFEPFDGKMPEGWRVGKLSEIGTIVGGGTPSKNKSEYYTQNGIAWITPKDLSNDKSKFISHGEIDITEQGFKNSSAIKMPKGTILYSSRAPIGYIVIAKNEVTTNQGFKSVIPNDNIGNAYVYYFLKSNFDLIDSLASGSTFKEISGTAMKNVPILIPDNKKLSAFQLICDSIFSKQENLEEENRKLTSLRDTLLPKLMSGEIDVESVKI